MHYSKPAIEVIEAQSVQMMAESLAISQTEVDGSQALTKEDEAWDIWNED